MVDNIEKINFIEIAITTLNEITQTYGFQMVNRVLVDIAKKLSLISGKENILFKLDGNKFGMLFLMNICCQFAV